MLTGVQLTGVQVRAARAMLCWEVAELAAASGVAAGDIERLEAGDGAPVDAAVDQAAIVRALERGGIEFLGGGAPGVRLRPPPGSLRPDELNAENDG